MRGRRARRRPDAALLPSETTVKAIILKNPEPSYTEAARDACVNGIVRVMLVLTAAGQVKYILPLRTMPYGLTEQAIEAARRIRFQPAMKDGAPVSQIVEVEYHFNCG